MSRSDRSWSSTEPALLDADQRGRILAALAAQFRDLDLVEDALQDAYLSALEGWRVTGVPANPAGWLYQSARRRAIDSLRRDGRFALIRTRLAAEMETLCAGATAPEHTVADHDIPDERLRLIFTCCHPALAESARVALTLKTLGRLSTAEIARAFLTPESTMAQRLVRAKRKLVAAGIRYRIPDPEQWPERLDSVLAVLYFIFNEGYAASTGSEPVRADLCQEAVRLGRIVYALAPAEPEAAALLAMMLLHDARRSARADTNGNLVALAVQDRRRWDHAQIAEGVALLRGQGPSQPGPYWLQAAISAVHACAPSHAATDWTTVAELYERLHALTPSPVVLVNRAVAVSFVDGPAAGLEALAGVSDSPALRRYQPFHAAHADLLRRAGRIAEAVAAYGEALALTGNAAERRFLEMRRASLTAPGSEGL